MNQIEFSAQMRVRGINPYVAVTAAQAAELKPGWRRAMPVLVQVNGMPKEPWHINMMPTGTGDYYLYLHGEVRKASQTKVDDTVIVTVRFDEAYRNGPMHDMPDWFQAALDSNSTAMTNWTSLSPSRQKEVLRYFAGLKSDEAKQRNLARAMNVLGGSDGHFMGRDWTGGA
jgi:hypothetical protein